MSERATHLYVVPRNGLRVLDPVDGKPLPEGGARKLRSRYWLRRIACADCRVSEPPRTQEPKPAARKPAKSEAKER